MRGRTHNTYLKPGCRGARHELKSGDSKEKADFKSGFFLFLRL